jgi:hypothetical protein
MWKLTSPSRVAEGAQLQVHLEQAVGTAAGVHLHLHVDRGLLAGHGAQDSGARGFSKERSRMNCAMIRICGADERGEAFGSASDMKGDPRRPAAPGARRAPANMAAPLGATRG